MNASNQHSRRHFLQSIAGVGGATLAAGLLPQQSTAASPLFQPADPAAGHIFMSAPYLQNPTPGSMVVMWITNLLCYSWVEFGETNALGQKAHSVTNGLVDAYNRINRIPLTGLKPGTKYYYRILSKEITGFEPYNLTYGETIQSDVFSFTTPEASPGAISCLILNDIHDRPQSIPHLLQMNEQPYDFVFFNGDIFDFQTNEQQIIEHMLQPCTGSFASSIPFLYVRGNHETRGRYCRDLEHYFCNPQGRQYFQFTWGPVHFTVLDTGEDKPDDTPVYAGIVDFDAYRREQQQWMIEEVVQSRAYKKAKFRVVLMHIPPFHSGDWHGPMHCRELFNPVFNKYKVDLCISGHTHRYGVHAPAAGEHNYPIIIGGGPKEGTRTLIQLKADQKHLDITMLDDSKKEVGNYRL